MPERKVAIVFDGKPIYTDDPAYIAATRHMDKCKKKYQQDHPCPQCGSHNTHVEPICICGPHSSWIEWCDDCGWEKRTES